MLRLIEYRMTSANSMLAREVPELVVHVRILLKLVRTYVVPIRAQLVIVCHDLVVVHLEDALRLLLGRQKLTLAADLVTIFVGIPRALVGGVLRSRVI